MITRGGRRGESGFTLVEMMIAMVVGIMVLSASTSLVVGSMRSMRGTELRDGMDRRARFIGIGLQRDVQQTGIAMDSRATFGTIGTFADTLVMLQVPYFVPAAGGMEVPADAYPRTATVGGSGVGNCGTSCVEVQRWLGETFQIKAGELAYLELAGVRRLLRVTAVTLPTATTARITFANIPRILGHPAGIKAPNLNLAASFTVRTVRAVAYYRDAQDQLNRAESVTTAGAAVPQAIASGVQSWDASVIFTNGVEADLADPDTDANPDNNFNDIVRVHLRATLEADLADPSVNNGVILTRQYDWWFSPRNLMYERNKL